MKTETYTTRSPDETRTIAQNLINEQRGRIILALHGELGSGKTCFVQGIAAALGARRSVTSPTFTILNEYHGSKNLYHMDLYRMKNSDEVLALGFEDYIESNGVVAVEWAERAADLFPSDTIHVKFMYGNEPDERIIQIDLPVADSNTSEKHT